MRLLFVLLALALPLTTGAAPRKFTWTNDTGNSRWSDPMNWGGSALVAESDLFFPYRADVPATSVNDFPAGTTFDTITSEFTSLPYTLSGNAITVTGGVDGGQFGITLNLPVHVTTSQNWANVKAGSVTVDNGVALTASGSSLAPVGSGSLTAAGSVTLSGSASEVSVTVASGGTQFSPNTVTLKDVSIGSMTVPSGGILYVANDAGVSSRVENLTLASGSTFLFTMDGGPLAVRGGAKGAGNVTLGNATLQLRMNSGSEYPVGTVILIDNDGTDPVNGTFANLPEGSLVSKQFGQTAQISYVGGDGNDVAVTVRRTTRNDFNADGKSDILWRHFAADGSIYLWGMNGFSVTNTGEISAVTDPNWKVAGIGDFNLDYKADVLWRNTSTGEDLVYLTTNPFGPGPHYTPQTINFVTDMNWDIAAVADYNGDGRDDIFWRNHATGENRVYVMNGAAIASVVDLPAVPDTNWKIAGAGTGIIWRNTSTGEVFYWQNPYSSAYTRSVTVVDLHWVIVGYADFDGDGNSDILWQNDTTGEVFLYLMTGAGSIYSTGSVTTVPDLNWKIVGTGDYDGDGHADILWRNSATGENFLYLMNGRTIVQTGALPGLPDLTWKVVP